MNRHATLFAVVFLLVAPSVGSTGVAADDRLSGSNLAASALTSSSSAFAATNASSASNASNTSNTSNASGPSADQQSSLQLRLSSPRLVADTSGRLRLTVSNPTATPLRNVSVDLRSSNGSVADRQFVPTLAAGENTTLTFPVRPRSAGETTYTVNSAYTDAGGDRATTSTSRSVDVEPLSDDVGVRVEPVSPQPTRQANVNSQLGSLVGNQGTTQSNSGSSQPQSARVTVTNFGNVPVSNAVVTPTLGNRSLPRYALNGSLAPGESKSVVVSLADVRRSDDIAFRVNYDIANRSGQTSASYDYRPPDGDVALTGINLSMTDEGLLKINGDAGNTGDATVGGVVISVGRSDHVSPAYPERNYFVGSIEGSGFAPFELTANVSASGVSEIPLTVTYTVDGVRHTKHVNVPYEQPANAGDGDRSGFHLGASDLVAIAVGVVLAIGLFAIYRRR